MASDPGPRTGLTRSGKVVAAAGVAGVVAGRVTGIQELAITGSCLLALVVCSWLLMRGAGTDLDVVRSVRPHRVEVGDRFTTSIRIHNGRSFLRFPIELTDALDGRPLAPLTLVQRRTDPACEADHSLPATHRGVTRFGPIAVRIVDPFGLTRTELAVPAPVDVIVLPRIHPVAVGAAAAADDPTGGFRHRRRSSTVSEEFDSLRDYVPGDDVRRVHWASTARVGRPMIRTYQRPSQRRTTVLLDDRADAYPPNLGAEPFERAVSAAASFLVACRDGGDLVRMITAGGDDSGYFDDHQRLDSVLDQLAAARPQAVGSLRGAIAASVATSPDDRVIVLTGAAPDADRALVAASAARGGEHTVVSTCSTAAAGRDRGVLHVVFGDGDDLDHCWQSASRSRPVGAGR